MSLRTGSTRSHQRSVAGIGGFSREALESAVDRCFGDDESVCRYPELLGVWEAIVRRLVLVRARIITLSLVAAVGVMLPASPALAAAPTSASCVGQFFSSHAGLAAQHSEPRNVGEFISATARELGSQFGATISGARNLPRHDCGL
jgi:hypothetical protein